MQKIDTVVKHWKRSKIRLNKGVDLIQIEELEEVTNFRFPQSFKAFYFKTNGFQESDWDENMFTIYSIERIKEEYLESKNKQFIPFCDYLINSHQIGFSKTDHKIYIDYHLDKSYNDKVADSFEQSLIEIILDSDKIY